MGPPCVIYVELFKQQALEYSTKELQAKNIPTIFPSILVILKIATNFKQRAVQYRVSNLGHLDVK